MQHQRESVVNTAGGEKVGMFAACGKRCANGCCLECLESFAKVGAQYFCCEVLSSQIHLLAPVCVCDMWYCVVH